MTQHRLWVVENAHDDGAVISEYLSQHEFGVQLVPAAEDLDQQILASQPDVLMLDVNLAGSDGYSICKSVRADFQGVIIVVGNDEVDEVLALEFGADDFVSRPLNRRVLLARLRMNLRRQRTPQPTDSDEPLVTVGRLTVSPSSRSVQLNGTPIKLTTAEFDVLWVLAQQAGQIVRRTELHRQLTGQEYDGKDRTIDLRVSRLRKKLEQDPSNPKMIKGIRGLGYLLATNWDRADPGGPSHDPHCEQPNHGPTRPL